MSRRPVLSEVPTRLWMHPAMTSALAGRDLGAVLRLVCEHTGWTQTVLSGRTGIAQSEISPIMAGTRRVQALGRLERIADGLGLPDEARMTLGLAPAQIDEDAPGDRARCTCRSAGETGECTMHRRQFLAGLGSATVSSAAGSALADPTRLAELIRHRSGSNVDEVTLDDMELTVDHLVRQVPVQSHHELFPLAARNWAAAEHLLGGWQTLGQRRRLIELAGQLSFYVGRLHYNAGRYPQAWRFATLTHRYATETEDLVLQHSAVILQSSVAFYGGNYRRAIEVLERGARFSTRYTKARGLDYAVSAHSALGDRASAVASMAEMRAAVNEEAARPGELPFTEASALLSSTSCLQRLGGGAEAISVGRETIAAFDAGLGSSRNSHAHSRISLALALTTGTGRDPEEAAALASTVVTSPDSLTGSVVLRLVELRAALKPWGRTPGVAVLSDQITARETSDRS
jgi:transcriptional regulator with XRE-family HTH domain